MANTEQTYGIFQFVEPDLSVPAAERPMFAAPAIKTAVDEKLVLHDFRTATDVKKGVEGLDTQGFTFLEHKSSIDPGFMLNGASVSDIEDTYADEVLDLMIKLTGAKRGIVHNIVFRGLAAPGEPDLSSLFPQGSKGGALAKPTSAKMLLIPSPQGPARPTHVDLSLDGLRRTVRYCSKKIAECGKAVLEAEDRKAAGEDVQVPRYAGYSVWRPLRTVKRDPLALSDWRSIDKSDIIATENRKPSNVNESGSYLGEAVGGLPPKNAASQRWYWSPEQRPDEIAIIKFADTASAEDESIAGGCLHASPIVPGTENEELRSSIETRVYLFWA